VHAWAGHGEKLIDYDELNGIELPVFFFFFCFLYFVFVLFC